MNHEQEIFFDKFFEHKEEWWPDSYGCKIASMIILPLATFLFLMPYQIWEGDYQCLLMAFFLEWMGIAMYLKPYYNYPGNDGKMIRVYDIVRYLPVSHKQITLYRWKKVIKLCLRLTGIAMVCQIIFSCAFLDTVSIGNIFMPFLCCFILPVGVVVIIDSINIFIENIILYFM